MKPNLVVKLWNHFFIVQEDVFNPSYLAALYLKNLDFQKKVYVLGTKGITQELDDVGIRHLGVGVRF
jgi:phosphoglycolate phosphatase